MYLASIKPRLDMPWLDTYIYKRFVASLIVIQCGRDYTWGKRKNWTLSISTTYKILSDLWVIAMTMQPHHYHTQCLGWSRVTILHMRVTISSSSIDKKLPYKFCCHLVPTLLFMIWGQELFHIKINYIVVDIMQCASFTGWEHFYHVELQIKGYKLRMCFKTSQQLAH